ncbi:MAG TPA: hypothetical protein VG123_16850 [Streptosporangiaceae bacterium]|jgi:hypothetical protein|nr:hypothetical protein [Streptosporangiaceae bacterium]
MKRSTRDAPPDGVPAGRVAGVDPAAGNARRTALTRAARLARFTAEIVAEILVGFPGC